jgi:glycosyltransferase involved in cell wall biosynthesis
MRRYLMITPYFPPMARSGAKRALFLSRHMEDHGWQPVVLAAPVVEDSTDERLNQAVPGSTPVHRLYAGPLRLARRLLPAKAPKATKNNAAPGPLGRWARQRAAEFGITIYFTPFDRYILDVPAATLAGAHLVRRYGAEAIHVSADPFTACYTGVAVKALTGRPLVLDLRDPWALHDGKMALRPRPTAWLVHRLERFCFEHADRVVLNTEAAAERYREHYRGEFPGERFTAIRNSFDPELFEEVDPEPLDRFTLLYFGTSRLFVHLDELLAGFARFIERDRLDPRQVQLLLLGEMDADDLAAAEKLGVKDYVHLRPPVPLARSMRYLRAADLLVLVIQDSCVLQIPGKLYDYLAAGRPILAVSANEEVNRLLAETGAGFGVSGRDPARIAEVLSQAYRRRDVLPDAAEVERRVWPFSANVMAEKLAAQLDAVTG